MPLHSDLLLQREAGLRLDIPVAGAATGRDVARTFASCALAGLLLAALILPAPDARATTYKWVDDQGVVHYTDKIPPEAINKGSVELNKQGVQIKKTDPALTPEQRRAREAEEERARLAAKAREEAQRKDRALLQSYTTESEIDLSKKRALGTIEGQMQSAQAYIATLTKRKEEIATRVAALGNKAPPQSLEREIANVNEELEKQAELVAAKQKEMVAVTARYDADKQRWHELRVIAEAEAASTTAVGGTPSTGSNAKALPTGSKK